MKGWKSVGLKDATVERLNKLKVHPRQSYDEIVQELLSAKEAELQV